MTQNSPIIAFFARGREIGYVRLTNGQLVRYGVKTIKGPRRGMSFRGRVEHARSLVFQAMEPGGLIVLEQRRIQSTAGALSRTIYDLSKRRKTQGYKMRYVSLDAVKSEVCGDVRVTQRELIEVIVQRYPILWPLIHCATAQQAKYWANVCLALALANAAMQKG